MSPIFTAFKQRLLARASKTLEANDACQYFKGKHVVLVGPSATESDELKSRIRASDVLVFVNKGYRSEIFPALHGAAKTSALFHSLDLDEATGAGHFTTLALRRLGFHSLFHPFAEDRFAANINAFHLRNTGFLRLRRIARDCYCDLQRSIKGFTPNTGYAAIWTIVCGGCASLYVTGVNFFRSPYSVDYHQHLESLQDAIALIERFGNHNPDLDLESFRVLYSQGRIKVDNVLKEILSKPPEKIFYRYT